MYFNQEKYVEESLNAVLAQTYSPLEIIISDDASTDGTWQIITSILATYTGPHKIITNQNEKNLGIIGNWNKSCSLSSGELLVKGDGDDISAPNRVERTVKEWLKYNKEPMLLSSSCNIIDMQGNHIGELKVPIDDGIKDHQKPSVMDGHFFIVDQAPLSTENYSIHSVR